eukprot:CAMPEP_0184743394 /NCGR_PEP_ID=MMETSP0315-20130426/6268_1 /TAXON_ID=101924 /ORGANISM="Rhodosorus marinus, Strain UTEX LB 2760" /LENGTH=449 /DNA_ID=CAMNT_0027214641 /DNA_START=159 /DNA_END=1508 /DNA_ORIENTATION=+
MGKKQRKKVKAEPLQDFWGGAEVEEDPRLANLPTAPRERDSDEEEVPFVRGAYVRREHFDRDRDFEGDGPEPSWERTGPIAATGGGFNRGGGAGFGSGSGDINWGERHGPVGVDPDGGRGFGGGSRGPEEEGNWRLGLKTEPVNASNGVMGQPEIDWNSRMGPIQPIQQTGPAGVEQDSKNWDNMQRGVAAPVAETGPVVGETDWSRGKEAPTQNEGMRGREPGGGFGAPRGEEVEFTRQGPLPPRPAQEPEKGPEAEFVRIGPLEARPEAKVESKEKTEFIRLGPIDSKPVEKNKENEEQSKDIDWSRRGPLESNPKRSTDPRRKEVRQDAESKVSAEDAQVKDIEWGVRGMAVPKSRARSGSRKDEGNRRRERNPRHTVILKHGDDKETPPRSNASMSAQGSRESLAEGRNGAAEPGKEEAARGEVTNANGDHQEHDNDRKWETVRR